MMQISTPPLAGPCRPPEDSDAAKLWVLSVFGRLVQEGAAVAFTLESGARAIRLPTGEIFRLEDTTVTRIA